MRSVFPGGEKKQNFPLTGEDERFAWDFCHSPRFAVDRYGIPWVFFINGTRQHVFYARWLDKQWSPVLNAYWFTNNTPRMDENHLSIERLAVEERMAEDAEGIGVSITHESRFPKTAYPHDASPVSDGHTRNHSFVFGPEGVERAGRSATEGQ